jgi:hypothetical protein
MGTRKFGDFFKELVGRSVIEFETTTEIEKAVEGKLGRKLGARYFRSGLISSGGVIPYCSFDRAAIDRKIDSLLRILERKL